MARTTSLGPAPPGASNQEGIRFFLPFCGTEVLMFGWYKRLVWTAFPVLTLVLIAPAQAQGPAPGSLWYNGDWNGMGALANERNTSIGRSNVYDNFIVPSGQTWNITGVYSDNGVTI